ncbi:hypothetical protein ACDX78_11770 [Virgibacillus oceani]
MRTLQQMDKETRDAVLAKLKSLNGVSQRQLSRITGISKTVIQRAGGSIFVHTRNDKGA